MGDVLVGSIRVVEPGLPDIAPAVVVRLLGGDVAQQRRVQGLLLGVVAGRGLVRRFVRGRRAGATGRSQATHDRRHRQSPPQPVPQRRPQPRALSPVERDTVRALLNSEHFVDRAPATVYHELLDEASTWRRCQTCTASCTLTERSRSGARQAVHPARVKSGLVATKPNAGRGASPSCTGRRGSPSSTCMWSSASTFCQRFFHRYNTEHRHSGIAWHIPHNVHHRRSAAVYVVRADVLAAHLILTWRASWVPVRTTPA